MANFSDKLNSTVNQYNDKKNKAALTRSQFIDHRIRQYTEDIKEICMNAAQSGQRSIKGFFVPGRTDYNYETTVDSAYVIDVPKNKKDEKPSKNMYGGIFGGNIAVSAARIYLFDGKFSADQTVNIKVDPAMIEQVRVGMVKNLSSEGFRKLSIEPLTGNVYDLKKSILGEHIALCGTAQYYYVDIEW